MLIFTLSVPVFAEGVTPYTNPGVDEDYEKLYPDFIPDNQYLIIGVDTTDEDVEPDTFYCYAFNGNRYSKVNFQTRSNLQTSGSAFYIDTFFKGVEGSQSYSTVTVYKLQNDDWVVHKEQNASANTLDLNMTISMGTSGSYATKFVGYVMESNVDLYDWEGEKLFPPAPPLGLEEVVVESLNNFQTTTGGTMKVLLLCGVGCLAFLMVLKVFGKVFRIFRV